MPNSRRWMELNAYFHKALCSAFQFRGWSKKDTKERLQINFALIADFDECYYVESVAGMSEDRLQQFIFQCEAYVSENGGFINDYDHNNKQINK